MKIGVVGLGFMGATHLDAWSKVPGFELAAVSSHDDKKLSGDLSGTSGNLDRGGQQMDFSQAARYHTAEELFADPNVERSTSARPATCTPPKPSPLSKPASMCSSRSRCRSPAKSATG